MPRRLRKARAAESTSETEDERDGKAPAPDDSTEDEPEAPVEGGEAASSQAGSFAGSQGPVSRFRRGSIRSIRMENFLSYSKCAFKVGPRLNIVVGPNGTGKSSIVCALALGLGGSPKILGRSENLADFVKHEEDNAHVEVVLQDHKNTQITVRREFKRGSNSSKWRMNKEPSTEAAVKAKMASLGIAVDNLCTFLPQDRVGDFSGFSPEQMLVETEKALGGEELYSVHQRLIERQQNSKREVDELDKVKTRLERLKKENEGLEREVRRMEDRKHQKEKLDLLLKRIMWLKVEQKRVAARAAKESVAKAQGELTSAQQASGPLVERERVLKDELTRARSRVEGLKKQVEKKAAEVKTHVTDCSIHLSKASDCTANLAYHEDDRKKKHDALVQARKGKEDLDKRLAKAETDAAGYERRLAELSSMLDATSEQRTAAEDELDAARYALEQVRREKEGKEQRLAQLSSARAQGIRRIRQKQGRDFQHALQALDWIENNRDKLKGKVHGPIALEVSVEDAAAARCLEDHVPNYLWMTFVTENDADRGLLIDEFTNGPQKLSVNVFNIEGGSLLPENGQGDSYRFSAERLAELRKTAGVRGVLEDFFQAPPAVLRVLRENAGVGSALLGTAETEQAVQHRNLLHDLSMVDGRAQNARIFVPGSGGRGAQEQPWQSYSTTVSSYSRKISTVVRPIPTGSLLSRGEDAGAIAAAKVALRDAVEVVSVKTKEFELCTEKLHKIQAKIKPIEDQRQDVRRRKGELTKLRGQAQAAERKVANLEQHLSSKSDGSRREHLNDLEKTIMRYTRVVELQQNALRKLLSLEASVAASRVEHDLKRRAHDAAAVKLNEEQEKCHELEAACQRARVDYERKVKEYKVDIKAARTQAPLYEVVNGKEDTEAKTPLHQKFDTLPCDLVELDEQVQECRDAIDKVVDNPQVLRLYEERKKDIADTERSLKNLQDGANAAEAEMNGLRGPWEDKLDSAVNQLDNLFKVYMRDMNCGGGVVLRKAPDGGSFKDWGIEILVRFRESTEMQVLSARVHSGGERSVSTVLYLMALQDLQQSPFRVVDEINQGMDTHNERLVFSRIVKNSVGPKRPQYFLITPKLLQGLVAMEHDDVTVLTIFNGPYNLKPHERFDVQAFIKKRRALMEAGEQAKNKRQCV